MIQNTKYRNILSACLIAAVACAAPIVLLLSLFAYGIVFNTMDVEVLILILIPISYLVYRSKWSDLAKATYLVIPLTAVFNMEVWKIPSKIEDYVSDIVTQSVTYAVIGVEVLLLIWFFRSRKVSWLYYCALICVSLVLLYGQLFLEPM